MRTLWNAVSFLAVAHLLAIAIFGAWLWGTDRLSVERIEAARALFGPTIHESQAAAEQAEREAEEARMAAIEEDRRLNPPFSSEVRIERIARLEEIEDRALRRLANERAVLIGQLEEALTRLDRREAEFESRRLAWEQSVAAERDRRASEQFAKTVRQYESIPPRQGKNMLLELVDAGAMDQAVAYLDAMNSRAASKLLTEFRTDAEIQLATELLERLRTLGLQGVAASEPQETDDASGTVADAR